MAAPSCTSASLALPALHLPLHGGLGILGVSLPCILNFIDAHGGRQAFQGRSTEWVTLHFIIPRTGHHDLPCDPATCTDGPAAHAPF